MPRRISNQPAQPPEPVTPARVRAWLLDDCKQMHDRAAALESEFMDRTTASTAAYAVESLGWGVLEAAEVQRITATALGILTDVAHRDDGDTAVLRRLAEYARKVMDDFVSLRGWEPNSTSPVANLKNIAQSTASARFLEMVCHPLGRRGLFKVTIEPDGWDYID